MDLLAAIKREERKLEKELGKPQGKLSGVRAAAKALSSKASREFTEVKKRVMSAAARAKISKAAKKRWAKFRAQGEKGVGIALSMPTKQGPHGSSGRVVFNRSASGIGFLVPRIV